MAEYTVDDPMQTHNGSAPTKLFVGGVSWETTQDGLKNYFAQFGEVVEAVIMRDKVTGRSRGFGFVSFSSDEAAEQVINATHTLDGRNIEPKRAVPRDQIQAPGGGALGATRTKKVFVGGLSPALSEQEFKTFFERFGVVTEAQILLEKETQRPRGFGFITYEAEDSVDRLFAEGSSFDLMGKTVDVKRAEPKRQGMGGYPPYGGPGGYYPPGPYGPPAYGYGPPMPGYGQPYDEFYGGRGRGGYPPRGYPPFDPYAYGGPDRYRQYGGGGFPAGRGGFPMRGGMRGRGARQGARYTPW